MRYKIRDGVLLVTICNESFLVSTLEAREYCPYITRISEGAAYIWNLIKNGLSDDEIIKSILNNYSIDKDTDINKITKDFIADLIQKGYILKEQTT